MSGPVVDLFGGPGGWEVAARALGLDPLGVEFDDAACATRAAAGLRTLQADVSQLAPREFMREQFGALVRLWGLIASPPCQAFSMAGKGAGRKAIEAYRMVIADLAAGVKMPAIDREWLDEQCGDPRGHLVLEPLRWALELMPRWITLEQVEPVLPLWEAMADALRAHGYAVWTGVLSAEQYGVAQTRRRAFLIASLDGSVSRPMPTHQRYVPPRKVEEATLGLFDAPEPERIVVGEDRELAPWVSMAQALGWGMTARPYPVIAGGTGGGPDLEKVGGSEARAQLYAEQAAGRWEGTFRPFGRTTKGGGHADGEWMPVALRANAQPNAAERSIDEPAPTITGGHDHGDRQWIANTGRDWKEGGSREDAQTFDADDRPAPTVDGKGRWHVSLKAGTGEHEAERGVDEPAPTLRFGARLNTVAWVDERPATATTLAGDARVFPPGGHMANDGRDNSRMVPRSGGEASMGAQAVRVSLAEALVLQSFPPDYPVQGTKTKQFEQVGNAVPPLLALAVLREAIG